MDAHQIRKINEENGLTFDMVDEALDVERGCAISARRVLRELAVVEPFLASRKPDDFPNYENLPLAAVRRLMDAAKREL